MLKNKSNSDAAVTPTKNISSTTADNTTPDNAPAKTTSSEEPAIESKEEKPEFPILNKELTEALTSFMYENFGGSGDEQYAASWYKYIDRWEVYQADVDFYIGELYLKERPMDASAFDILSKYYTEGELSDIICPMLLDIGAYHKLKEVDLSLIGENLYFIKTRRDTSIYFYSLSALGIPIFDFLAEGSGWSVSEVKNAVMSNSISGVEVYNFLVAYMGHKYKGSFDGLSMKDVKSMSMSALANFKDVRIERLIVLDQNRKLVNIYRKPN